MIYNPIRTQLRNIIVNRNTKNIFKILLADEFKEPLKEIHTVVYKNLSKNNFDNQLFIELALLEQGFYQTSYEVIAGIDFTAAEMGLKPHKTTQLNPISFEKEIFPHNLIIKLEEVVRTVDMGIASQQKTEFKIIKELITQEKYEHFFKRHTGPLKIDYVSNLAIKMYELHNILYEARRTLLNEHIQKIY